MIICEPTSHNHDSNEFAHLKRQKFSNGLKRTAITDISIKPSKLICTELSAGYITSTASDTNQYVKIFSMLEELFCQKYQQILKRYTTFYNKIKYLQLKMKLLLW